MPTGGSSFGIGRLADRSPFHSSISTLFLTNHKAKQKPERERAQSESPESKWRREREREKYEPFFCRCFTITWASVSLTLHTLSFYRFMNWSKNCFLKRSGFFIIFKHINKNLLQLSNKNRGQQKINGNLRLHNASLVKGSVATQIRGRVAVSRGALPKFSAQKLRNHGFLSFFFIYFC